MPTYASNVTTHSHLGRSVVLGIGNSISSLTGSALELQHVGELGRIEADADEDGALVGERLVEEALQHGGVMGAEGPLGDDGRVAQAGAEGGLEQEVLGALGVGDGGQVSLEPEREKGSKLICTIEDCQGGRIRSKQTNLRAPMLRITTD